MKELKKSTAFELKSNSASKTNLNATNSKRAPSLTNQIQLSKSPSLSSLTNINESIIINNKQKLKNKLEYQKSLENGPGSKRISWFSTISLAKALTSYRKSVNYEDDHKILDNTHEDSTMPLLRERLE